MSGFETRKVNHMSDKEKMWQAIFIVGCIAATLILVIFFHAGVGDTDWGRVASPGD